MAGAAVKIKIMPSSPDVNLEELEVAVKQKIESVQGSNVNIVREPIAFGLHALIVSFAWDEGSDRDKLEADLSAMENISSAEIIDFRRAFG